MLMTYQDIRKEKQAEVHHIVNTSIERISFRFGGDRIAHGLRVLGLDKIDHLILSGGSGFVTRPDLKESIYVAEYLDQIGMPKRKFWIESESKNTYENAVYTKALLEEKGLLNEPIILITSGYHMPRSIACIADAYLRVLFKTVFCAFFECLFCSGYFPIQKLLKILPKRSSVVTSPVMAPR